MGRMPKVNCQYGAPMGRRERHRKPETRTVRLFRVRLFRVRIDSGGYDDGGAYWGLGRPLYCATDGEEYTEYVRARSREDAARQLEIEALLIRGIK